MGSGGHRSAVDAGAPCISVLTDPWLALSCPSLGTTTRTAASSRRRSRRCSRPSTSRRCSTAPAQLLRRHFGETRVAINRISADRPGAREVVLVSDPRQPSPELGHLVPARGLRGGQGARRRAPVRRRPAPAEGAALPRGAAPRAYGYGSLVSFPLVFENELLGTLDIAHPPAEGLLDCCFEVARQVAHLVAIALHNSLMVEEVQRLNRLLGRENALLKEEIRQIKRDARYVAESPAMRDVVERVRLVAPVRRPPSSSAARPAPARRGSRGWSTSSAPASTRRSSR